MDCGMKLVDFDKYCQLCKHQKKDGQEYPCDECLSVPARENSHVPERFQKKDGVKTDYEMVRKVKKRKNRR